MKLSKAHKFLHENKDYFDKKDKALRQDLDKLELIFAELDNPKKVDKEFDELEDDNYHCENSLLLATQYGTAEEIEEVKDLIIKNRSETGSIKRSKLHQKRMKLTFHVKNSLIYRHDYALAKYKLELKEAKKAPSFTFYIGSTEIKTTNINELKEQVSEIAEKLGKGEELSNNISDFIFDVEATYQTFHDLDADNWEIVH